MLGWTRPRRHPPRLPKDAPGQDSVSAERTIAIGDEQSAIVSDNDPKLIVMRQINAPSRPLRTKLAPGYDPRRKL